MKNTMTAEKLHVCEASDNDFNKLTARNEHMP